MILLIQFFLAHILGDFFLQWHTMVRDKELHKLRSPYLYLHALIHGALLLLLTGGLCYWPQALLIAVLHLLTDWLKAAMQQNNLMSRRRWFFIDQLLHIVVLLGVWAYTENIGISFAWIQDQQLLTYATAFLFLTLPTSFIIKSIISKWIPELPAGSNDNQTAARESLIDAGQLIGIIERLLAWTFIVAGKWEGVGFLLTAKSVFRFGELNTAKEKKLTEYVLIGTLLSFGIAVLTGVVSVKLAGG
jgi:hypothetical protein